MRSRLLVTPLLALALLALPAIAVAGPKPIKKPDAPAKTATPPAKKTVVPTHTSTATTGTTTRVNTTPTTPIKHPSSTGSSSTDGNGAKTQIGGAGTVTPKVISVNVVGRDQSGAEITLPKDTTPVVVAPDPTPLALVSVGDRIRSHSTPTPAWMLALLAVLAAAEAFLVVRLVRNRPGGGGISTAS